MKTVRRVSVAALLAVGMASSCAQQEEALIVSHSPAFVDGDCFADPSQNTQLQRGVLDVAYGTAYTLPVVLTNNLGARPGTTSNTGVENGELQLRDVDVTLTMEQAPDVLRAVAAQNGAFVEFSQTLASVSLQPGQETGVLVDVITDGASRALRDAIQANLDAGARPIVTAEVVFHATRTGNSTGSLGVIDARAYTFPIQVCIGCLPVTCETCPDAQCPPDAAFVGPCGNAQDSVLVPSVCEAPAS